MAVGTGSKCLGENELSLDGSLVHDSHAEIIARRAFIIYLLHELENSFRNTKVKDSTKQDLIFEYDEKLKYFALKGGIRFHFYTTHPPCGDATIAPKPTFRSEININQETNPNHLQIKRQKLEIQSFIKDIHRTGAKCIDQSIEKDPFDTNDSPMAYHTIGAIRRKPGRGDPTQSLSCSDKMAKWNFVGLQGSFLSLLIPQAPILWSTITIGSEQCNIESVNRCLLGRFKNNENLLREIPLLRSDVSFPFSKTNDSKSEFDANPLIPCSSTIACAQSDGQLIFHDVLVNGRKQGVIKKYFGTPKSRVSICPLNFSKRFIKLLKQMHTACVSEMKCDICEVTSDKIKYCNLKQLCQNSNGWYKDRINAFYNFLPGLKEARQLRRDKIENFYIE